MLNKTMINKFCVIALLMVLSVNGYAVYYNVISELGSSARSIGLGNVDGFSDSATAVFSNPANLYQTKGYSVSFFTANLMNEINYSNFALNTRVGKGIVGVGFYDARVDNLIETAQNNDTDQTVANVGTFDYKSSIMKLAYQQSLNEKTSLGTSLSFFNHRFAEVKGTGYNLDLGMIHAFEKFKLSIFAQNVLRDMPVSYLNDSASVEMLPFLFSVSAMYPLNSFEFYPQIKFDRSEALLSTGVLYTPKNWPFLDFMLGYKQQLDALQNKQSRFSLGFGLNLGAVSLYYAYERSDYYLMDNNNYFSIHYVL
jgi:hypothetical protein